MKFHDDIYQHFEYIVEIRNKKQIWTRGLTSSTAKSAIKSRPRTQKTKNLNIKQFLLFLLTTASSGQNLTQKWFKIQFQVFQQRMMENESVFSVSISWPETFFWNENNSFSISRIFFSRFFRISKLLFRMNMTPRLRHTTFRYVSDL